MTSIVMIRGAGQFASSSKIIMSRIQMVVYGAVGAAPIAYYAGHPEDLMTVEVASEAQAKDLVYKLLFLARDLERLGQGFRVTVISPVNWMTPAEWLADSEKENDE